MSKLENKLARSIVAMLLCRKRAAYKRLRREWEQGERSDKYYNVLCSHYSEAHNAAESARRMLYGID